MKIMIEVGFCTVFVRYSEEITRARQSALFDALLDAYRDWPGVQSVKPERYSAMLMIAPWVATETAVAKDIYDHLFDEIDVDEYLTAEYGEDWELGYDEPDPAILLAGLCPDCGRPFGDDDVDDDDETDDSEAWKG